MSHSNPPTLSEAVQSKADQVIPLVIKVVSPAASAKLDSTDSNFKIVKLDEFEKFKDEVNQHLGVSDDLYRPVLRILGYGKKEPPIIFIIDEDLIKPELLKQLLQFISSLEKDRYVFQVFVKPVDSDARLSEGEILSSQAEDLRVIQLMQNVATGFAKQKRRSGLERLSILVTERIAIFIIFPLLIGLFSGIGEGFITRQVPEERFVFIIDFLFYFLAVIASLVVLFPFLLFVLFSVAIWRLFKRLK
jgi:hypothetical protein